MGKFIQLIRLATLVVILFSAPILADESEVDDFDTPTTTTTTDEGGEHECVAGDECANPEADAAAAAAAATTDDDDDDDKEAAVAVEQEETSEPEEPVTEEATDETATTDASEDSRTSSGAAAATTRSNDDPKKAKPDTCPDREHLMRCASVYLDTNKNGKLDRSELQEAIGGLPWYARGVLSILGSLDKMMKKCDVDKDDAISIDYDMEHNKDTCLASCFKRRAFKAAFFSGCDL
ncbi:hypothetical protein ACA910_012731 [Epithemia clementina (nom. ined.)]